MPSKQKLSRADNADMYLIQFEPEASNDFERIYDHYAYERGAVEFANRLDNTFRDAISSTIAAHPYIGRPIRGTTRTGFVLLVNRSHFILYVVQETNIIIVRILAAAEVKDASLKAYL